MSSLPSSCTTLSQVLTILLKSVERAFNTMASCFLWPYNLLLACCLNYLRMTISPACVAASKFEASPCWNPAGKYLNTPLPIQSENHMLCPCSCTALAPNSGMDEQTQYTLPGIQTKDYTGIFPNNYQKYNDSQIITTARTVALPSGQVHLPHWFASSCQSRHPQIL